MAYGSAYLGPRSRAQVFPGQVNPEPPAASDQQSLGSSTPFANPPQAPFDAAKAVRDANMLDAQQRFRTSMDNSARIAASQRTQPTGQPFVPHPIPASGIQSLPAPAAPSYPGAAPTAPPAAQPTTQPSAQAPAASPSYPALLPTVSDAGLSREQGIQTHRTLNDVAGTAGPAQGAAVLGLTPGAMSPAAAAASLNAPARVAAAEAGAGAKMYVADANGNWRLGVANIQSVTAADKMDALREIAGDKNLNDKEIAELRTDAHTKDLVAQLEAGGELNKAKVDELRAKVASFGPARQQADWTERQKAAVALINHGAANGDKEAVAQGKAMMVAIDQERAAAKQATPAAPGASVGTPYVPAAGNPGPTTRPTTQPAPIASNAATPPPFDSTAPAGPPAPIMDSLSQRQAQIEQQRAIQRQQPAPAAQPAGPRVVNSQQEYDALPPGTSYTDSTGRQAIKR